MERFYVVTSTEWKEILMRMMKWFDFVPAFFRLLLARVWPRAWANLNDTNVHSVGGLPLLLPAQFNPYRQFNNSTSSPLLPPPP
jgi:hypothetical protein